MAQLTYESKDAIPEDLREDAKELDGKYVVTVAPNSKLEQFRNNNITVSKERDSVKQILDRITAEAGFDPADPDAWFTGFKDLRTTKDLVDNGKLIKDTSLDEALAKRTGEMTKSHEAALNAERRAKEVAIQQVQDLTSRLDRTKIDAAINAVVGDERSGLRSDASKAVLREAYDFFNIVEGKLVAKDHEGNVIYGSDGATPMTPMEWVKTRLINDAPYLFKASEGDGSGGGGGGALSAKALEGLSPVERMNRARAQ